MKNSTITLLSIGLSLILAIGILIAVVAGFLYMGAMAWESGWARGDSLEGHDGYTYCIMHETGIGQDPHTKLIRTKNIKDENSYEDLGSVNAESSWLTVIRSTKISKGGHTIIYITSNNKAFAVSYNNYVPFIFDPENEVFYEGDDATMSPFILIENEDSDLYDPDVIRVIWRTVTDLSGWPASDDVKDGLSHPNTEVRKVAKWVLEIQENGLSYDSETIHEIIDFLTDNLKSEDFITKLCIIETLARLNNPYATKALPYLEDIAKSNKYLGQEASKTIRHIKSICESP